MDIGAYESQIISTAPSNQSPAQGVATNMSLGSFTDLSGAAAGPWNVDVNWGDGTPDTIFTANSIGTLPNVSHVFAQFGNITTTVTVTAANHDANQATFQVNVGASVAVSLGVVGIPTPTPEGVPTCSL